MKFLYTLRNKNYFINKNKTLEKFLETIQICNAN